jgi:hypothetical protein
MPAITFSQFDAGLDRRKHRAVADANRLWLLENAYITTGKALRQRPGLTLEWPFATNQGNDYRYAGMLAANGVLNVFSDRLGGVSGQYGPGNVPIATWMLHDPQITSIDTPPGPSLRLYRVDFADSFNGYLYVVATFATLLVPPALWNFRTYHFYLNEGASPLWTPNTPKALGATVRVSTGGGVGVVFKCDIAGTTGATQPNWAALTSNYVPTTVVADGTMQWRTTNCNVTDPNCPQYPGLGAIQPDANYCPAIVKLGGKIYAVDTPAFGQYYTADRGIVRYCATNNPLDWSSANDAGFLPVAINQSGTSEVTALAAYREGLLVFFADSAQHWLVDPDPAKNVLRQRIFNAGTVFPKSVQQLAGDVIFLSQSGFKSVTQSLYTDNLLDVDIGEAIKARLAYTNASIVQAAYYPQAGQYWCRVDNDVWVYSFSRVSKLSAWSRYHIPALSVQPAAPFETSQMAALGGELYLKVFDGPSQWPVHRVYRVDEAAATDDGAPIDYTVELAHLDFKQPGVLKQITGVDGVFEGAPLISYRYDPRDENLITAPYPLLGDTRPGEMTPVEICATSIAPVFTRNPAAVAPAPFALHALTFYFEALGPL